MKNIIFNSKARFAIISLIILLFSMFIITPLHAEATEAKVEIVGNKVVLNTGFNDQNEAFHHVIERYKVIIVFFAAMATITMVGIFIFNFMKLASSASNPMERQKCITGLIISGIATGLLGSVGLFVGLFYNVFK